MEHLCDAKHFLDKCSKINCEDVDGKESKFMPAVSTMDTIPSLSDSPPMFSNIPATHYPDRGHGWDDEPSLDDKYDMQNIDEYEHVLVPGCDKDPLLEAIYEMDEIDDYEELSAPECSSDEGRRCDISYTDCYDDSFSDCSHSGWNDPLMSERHPDPPAPKKCSFLRGPKTVPNKVGKVPKRLCKFGNRSNGDEEVSTVLFCNRRLKTVKTKREEDPEVQLLAKFSIMTQIAQHAGQAQDFFTPSLKAFGQHVSAGPSFGRNISAPAGDLNFEHGSSRKFPTPLLWQSKSPTSNHFPDDPCVDCRDDEFAESPVEV